MKITIDINETLRANGKTTIGLAEYGELRKQAFDASFLLALPDEALVAARPLFKRSRGQLRQDILALAYCNFTKDGYFVEFGATNGVKLSNTVMLERAFGWRGILAEPARGWHEALRNNRACAIETDCVWHTTGETLTFHEADVGELSTIQSFVGGDGHARKRAAGTSYDVTTISLADMLAKHGAPRQIDYLSVDTEGSELAILKPFDFDAYRFKVITCEHNSSDTRDGVLRLLTEAGYVRVHEDISAFDDWFVDKSLVG